MRQIPAGSAVVYPAEDAVPKGETGLHALALQDLLEQLGELFHGRDDVAIEGNRFVYWVEGEPEECVNPDVFVSSDRPRAARDTWKTWEEDGRFADVVFEISSRSTRRKDLGEKKATYELLGVREYVIFDPRREWVPEGVRAWRLVDGELRRIPTESGRVWLATLGVTVEAEGERIRLVLPDGRRMLHSEERREELRAAQEENEALRSRIAELERGRG
jgi:Uma2 family endonuclease